MTSSIPSGRDGGGPRVRVRAIDRAVSRSVARARERARAGASSAFSSRATVDMVRARRDARGG